MLVCNVTAATDTCLGSCTDNSYMHVSKCYQIAPWKDQTHFLQIPYLNKKFCFSDEASLPACLATPPSSTVSPTTVASTTAGVASRGSSKKSSKEFYEQTWFYVVLAAAALVLLVACVCCCYCCCCAAATARNR